MLFPRKCLLLLWRIKSFHYLNSAESSPLTAVTSRLTRGASPQSLTNERALCKWSRAGSPSSVCALLPLSLRVTTDPRALSTHSVITLTLRYTVKKRAKCASNLILTVQEEFLLTWTRIFFSYWSYWRAKDAQDEVQSKWLFIHARYFRKLHKNTSAYYSKICRIYIYLHHT